MAFVSWVWTKFTQINLLDKLLRVGLVELVEQIDDPVNGAEEDHSELVLPLAFIDVGDRLLFRHFDPSFLNDAFRDLLGGFLHGYSCDHRNLFGERLHVKNHYSSVGASKN